MELVVDANVFVAAFLRAATSRKLLLDDRLSLWTPQHGLEETRRVLLKPRLAKRLGGLSESDIRWFLAVLMSRVLAVPSDVYRTKMTAARVLATHEQDVPYFAVALHRRCALWSNDAEMKQQQAVRVYTTEELLQRLRGEGPHA